MGKWMGNLLVYIYIYICLGIGANRLKKMESGKKWNIYIRFYRTKKIQNLIKGLV